jgi:hypothetical protein
VQGYEQDDSAQ